MTYASDVDHKPGSLGWIKALTHELTGQKVESVLLPGGKGRQSVRLQMDDGQTVIATRRSTAARAEAEFRLLTLLSSEGAPVPQPIGFRDGLLVQQDAGRNRLSFAMVHADPARRAELARSAMAALNACRAVLDTHPDVLAALPGLGSRKGWAEDLVSRPFFLSGDLRIASPEVDADALALSLSADPTRFTRWDARLSDAAVQADGTVMWFDWDMFGRRAGVEDLGWLIADDWWGLDRLQTEALLDEAVAEANARTMVRRVAMLIAANRLSRITAKVSHGGWVDPDDALRLDQLGAVPAVVESICGRMADLSRDDPLIAGFAPWFQNAGQAIATRYPADP